MFVGEAPGANEDKQGLPFVGQAGRLLDTLLGEIGLTRGDVFVANVLKCRPPGNRDPLPQEIDNCQDYLFRQLELIEPKVVCTLGNFATKLLRGDMTGITRLHGRDELRQIGPRVVRLYPLFHPAAALYTPAMLATLRADFAAHSRPARQARARTAGACAGARAGRSKSRSWCSCRTTPTTSNWDCFRDYEARNLGHRGWPSGPRARRAPEHAARARIELRAGHRAPLQPHRGDRDLGGLRDRARRAGGRRGGRVLLRHGGVRRACWASCRPARTS